MHIRKTKSDEVVPAADPNAILPQYIPIPILRPEHRFIYVLTVTIPASDTDVRALGPFPAGSVLRKLLIESSGYTGGNGYQAISIHESGFSTTNVATTLALPLLLPQPIYANGARLMYAPGTGIGGWLDVNFQLRDDTRYLLFYVSNNNTAAMDITWGVMIDTLTARDV